MAYSTDRVDLLIKITISGTNLTPEDAKRVTDAVSVPYGGGLDVQTKMTTTAAWIDDPEPTPQDTSNEPSYTANIVEDDSTETAFEHARRVVRQHDLLNGSAS